MGKVGHLMTHPLGKTWTCSSGGLSELSLSTYALELRRRTPADDGHPYIPNNLAATVCDLRHPPRISLRGGRRT